jgi:DNA-binding MarR family transcriptional regulator
MTAATPSRSEATDLVAATLLTRASRLTRLLLRLGASELTRTEAGLLATLLEGPRRITELAETEALAQPTVTRLVDRLEARGLVERARSAEDGRVVFVSPSPAGRALLEETRAQSRVLMRGAMEQLGDDDVHALAGASEALDRVISQLQGPGTARGRAAA